LGLAAALGFFTLSGSAMMDSLLRARNALQNQGSDSATKEKWFEDKESILAR
jgi:hypothetical protein